MGCIMSKTVNEMWEQYESCMGKDNKSDSYREVKLAFYAGAAVILKSNDLLLEEVVKYCDRGEL